MLSTYHYQPSGKLSFLVRTLGVIYETANAVTEIGYYEIAGWVFADRVFYLFAVRY